MNSHLVSKGVLRVDAARAIEKLRDYQLAEPAAWVLEAIRAAVASGATRVSLSGDSNDIWLQWQGPNWDPEILPTLLSELVSPQTSGTQHLRLLATAVNSALALSASYVDVYSIIEGHAQKVRFAPSVISSSKTGEGQGLAALKLEATNVPKRSQDATIFLHLRRSFGLSPLQNLLQGESPELPIAREACRQLQIPIDIAGVEYGHALHSDLIQVPLCAPAKGHLALTSDSTAQEILPTQVAEHGVRICTYDTARFDSTPRTTLPLRFYIDGKQMPTNASHSEVRKDAFPVREAEAAFPRLFASLCIELEERLTSQNTSLPLQEAAIQLLASFIAGPDWSRNLALLPAPLQALAKLPLVRNALGERRTLLAVWDAAVHIGETPLPENLASWFSTTLWAPPGSLERLLWGAHQPKGLGTYLTSVKQQVKVKERFLAHTIRPSKLSESESHIVVTQVPAIEGELALLNEGQGGTIIILVEGRTLEEYQIPCSIAFVAIVADPALTPETDYSSAVRNHCFAEMVSTIRRAVVSAVAACCNPPHLGLSVQSLRTMAQRSWELLGQLEGALHLTDHPELASYPCWHLTTGDWASTSQLRQAHVIGYTMSMQKLVLPERLIVYCDTLWKKNVLARLLLGKQCIDYSKVPTPSPESIITRLAQRMRSWDAEAVVLPVLALAHRGVVAWTRQPQKRYFHCSKELRASSQRSGSHISFMMDDDTLVPTPSWDQIRSSDGASDYTSEESALVCALTRALVGQPTQLLPPLPSTLESFAGQRLIDALLRNESIQSLLGEKLYRALGQAKLFSMYSAEGRSRMTSATDLANHFPQVIHTLRPEDNLRSLGNGDQVLVANARTASLAQRLCNRPLSDFAKVIEQRGSRTLRQNRIAAHQAKPKALLAQTMLDADSWIAFETKDFSGWLGLPSSLEPGASRLQVQVDGRRFQTLDCRLSLPLLAVVELTFEQVDLCFAFTPEAILSKMSESIAHHTLGLLMQCHKEDPEALLIAPHVTRLFEAWLNQGGTAAPSKQEREQLGLALHFRDERDLLLPLSSAVHGNELRFCSHDAPRQANLSASLGSSIVVLPKDASVQLPSMLCSLLGQPATPLDCSKQLQALHVREQMRSGQLSLPGSAQLKRSLEALGEVGVVGEIAFADADLSEIRFHSSASDYVSIQIVTEPPVVVALLQESQSYASAPEIDRLTLKLLQAVVAPNQALPPWHRYRLTQAMLGNRLPEATRAHLRSAPLFQNLQGQQLSWQQVTDHNKEHNTLWYSLRKPEVPVATTRLVLVLGPQELADQPCIPLLDVSEEIRIDALAQANKNKKLGSISLSPAQSALALTTAVLSGVTEGTIAPLLPEAFAQRGCQVSHQRIPLGTFRDPCRWPTLCLVDDALLVPNRTWTAVVDNLRWETVLASIAQASEQALLALFVLPSTALCSAWVAPLVSKEGQHLCGHFWLSEPTLAGRINIRHADVETTTVPLELPLMGELLVSEWNAESEAQVVAMARNYFGDLVQRLAETQGVSADIKSSFAAISLSRQCSSAQELGEMTFDCFNPSLTAYQLESMLQSTAPVETMNRGETCDTTAPVLVDDGYLPSQVLAQILQERLVATKVQSPTVVALPNCNSPVYDSTLELHVLTPLAAALHRQLSAVGISVDRVRIDVERGKPPLVITDTSVVELTLAGKSTQLLAIETLTADGSMYNASVEALAAHALTLLNRTNTSVTDATEAHALQALLSVP